MSVNKINYVQGNNISDTISSSIGSTDTSIPVSNISSWSINGGKVIIDRNTTNEEIIYTSGVSGSSLVVPSGGRGAEGTTAVGHNSGATIESVPTAGDWNDLIDGVLNILSQSDGTVKTSLSLTTPKITTSINDSNGNEVIKTPATTSAVNEVTITNAATGNAPQVSTTGDDTNIDLNIVSKGTGVVKFNGLAAPVGGWIKDSDTYTYVSASSFKVSGKDVTTRFTKGTRIKLTQTTDEYFVVTSSTFSTDTTVNITGGSDYTLANATITNPNYSYEANPQGYPGWFAYTPTLGGFSANPTGVVAKFSVSGNNCYLRIYMPNAGTSNSTSLTITTPITSANDGLEVSLFGTGVKDNGTAIAHTGPCILSPNSSTITTYTSENFGTWTASGTKQLKYIQGLYAI